jgi:CBS domain-containing protein
VAILRGDSGGCVVVVELEGTRPRPVGIFTERDYLDKIAALDPAAWEESQLSPVENFMTVTPRTIPQSESLETAIQLMTQGGYRHLPLVDRAGYLVGVISARDIIRHLAEFFPLEVMNLPPRLHQDERIQSREGG